MELKLAQKIMKCLVLICLGMAVGSGLIATHQYYQQLNDRRYFASRDHRSPKQLGGLTNAQRHVLENLNYHPHESVIVYVNHGRSTLNPHAWQKNQVIYHSLDRLNRTSEGNVAFLEQRNHADTTLRTDQATQPSGWHDNYAGNLVYNRGHLIAYSLTADINSNTGQYTPTMVGDQNNPRNLFTETDFINQEVQTMYEAKVRHAIERGEHVIYAVTPIFRGNELVPRGINLQAISTNGRINFNVFLFNVEPGVVINYQNGSYSYQKQMVIPVPLGAESAADNDHSQNSAFQFIGSYSRPEADHPRQYIRKW